LKNYRGNADLAIAEYSAFSASAPSMIRFACEDESGRGGWAASRDGARWVGRTKNVTPHKFMLALRVATSTPRF